MSDNAKNNRNNVALTVVVESVVTRSGKVVGKGKMTFVPKGKPAFDLPVTVMADEGSEAAKGIKVGVQNVMGSFLYKEEEYQGATRREYTIWIEKAFPAKEGAKPWRRVTFEGWVQNPLGDRPCGVRYSDTSGEPYATHTLALGMGKDKKKLYMDVKAFSVKGDTSVVMALGDADPGDTIRVTGTLEANQSTSNRVYLSVIIFPPKEGENGEAGEPTFTLVKKGEPRETAPAASAAGGSPFENPFDSEP